MESSERNSSTSKINIPTLNFEKTRLTYARERKEVRHPEPSRSSGERGILRAALRRISPARDPHSTRSGCAVTCSGQALRPRVKTVRDDGECISSFRIALPCLSALRSKLQRIPAAAE